MAVFKGQRMSAQGAGCVVQLRLASASTCTCTAQRRQSHCSCHMARVIDSPSSPHMRPVSL